MPVAKKIRRFSSPTTSPTILNQLVLAFPDMDRQLLEKAITECGSNDLESAITKLHELRLGEQANVNNSTNNLPVDGAGWVEFLVHEMMKATSVDDAKSRATRVLESLEKSIRAHVSDQAAQNPDHDKQKNMMKEQIERLVKENGILKRAVAIQHERQKEYDSRNQEVQQLKDLVGQYQEKLKTLEVNNFALRMFLQQADHQGNSMIPNRFHPDVF